MEREARNVRAKQEQGTERKKICQSRVLKETENKYDKVTMRNRMPAQNCKRPWNHIQLIVNKLQQPMNEKYGGVRAHVRMYACMYLCTYVCVYACNVCTYVCTYSRIYIYIYALLYICTWVFAFMNIHTTNRKHIREHTPLISNMKVDVPNYKQEYK